MEKSLETRKDEFGLEAREFVNKMGFWRVWCFQDGQRGRGRRFSSERVRS